MAEDMFADMLKQIRTDYETSDYPVVDNEFTEEKIELPMSDKVRLITYLFYEKKAGRIGKSKKKYPVIIQRSPYFHAMEFYRMHGENLAKRGFVYIVQFCRGTGESEGAWLPNENERKDGLETLQWLEEQSWVKSIGYWGDSYLALTGWCVADHVPEKVKGMYLGEYGTDRFTSAYSKGMFRHDVLTSWAMENAGFPITADYLESCRYRPQIEVDEKLWGQKISWYRDWITAGKQEDPYWQNGFWKMLHDIPAKIKIPLFISEGWYDHHLGSAMKTYQMLSKEEKKKCILNIGCWNHYSMNCMAWGNPKNLRNSEIVSMLDWFDTLLIKNVVPEGKIQLYAIGGDQWKTFSCWPPEHINRKRYVLHHTKGKVSYVYDPENPVLSCGAESMLKSMEKVGSLSQPDPGYRKDVVTFLLEPMEKSTLIIGKIKAFLQVSSDCEDTAFTAKIMVKTKDGNYVNIRSGITTIEADCGNAYQPGKIVQVCIEMWDIVWKINKGDVLRIDVSSSDFPQYAVHSNNRGNWSEQVYVKQAEQTVFCGSEGDSYIEIPILEEQEG